MRKRIIILVAVFAFLTGPVMAQVSGDVRAEVKVGLRRPEKRDGLLKNFEGARENMKGEREAAKAVLEQERNDARDKLKNARVETEDDLRAVRDRGRAELNALRGSGDRAAFEARRAEFEAALQSRRDAAQARFEEKREEAKNRIEARRAELKARLEKIKDDNKKAAVERIEKRIHELNVQLMRHFAAALVKIENALNRIASRADKAATNGVNVESVRGAILAAQTAIAAARSGVEAQAGAVYEINFTDESDLRASVQAVRDQFKRDVEAVRTLVKNAHEAVRQAATALAQIPRVDEFEVAVEAEIEIEAEGSVN